MLIINYISGYPRYTADVHNQFKNIIKSMNRDIGVTVATSNSLFHQELTWNLRIVNNWLPPSGRISNQGEFYAGAGEELRL